MTNLVIEVRHSRDNEVCTLCKDRLVPWEGLQLALADGSRPVCRRCGQKQAPALAALLELGATAERVGRIERHNVSPPITALLNLARAAENYAHWSSGRPGRAA
jgi:hypothetical protein